MRLESIRLRNFRSFKDAEKRNIPNLRILVGANGVGRGRILHEVIGWNGLGRWLLDCDMKG